MTVTTTKLNQAVIKAFPAQHLIVCLLSSVALGVAWLVPMTHSSVLLTVLAFTGFCILLEARCSWLCFWLFGALSQAIGFYWLVGTMSFFGGFPWGIAAFIFFAYCLAFGCQVPIAAWLARRIPITSSWLILPGAIGWTITELAFPRLFPWSLAHTLVSLPYVPLLSTIGGSYLVAMVSMALIHSVVRLFRADRREKIRLVTGVFVLCLFVCGYGVWRTSETLKAIASAQSLSVAIPQANVSVQEKHNQRSFTKNTTQYVRLSDAAIKQHHPDLVIWPETVVQDWLPTAARSVLASPRFPRLPGISEAHPLTPLIFGALTYTNADTLHNSAVTISSNGSVPSTYHKQILLPFGEYMPFAETFPWLQKLNPLAAGAFTAGTEPRLVTLPFLNNHGSEATYRVGSLICYEDIVPSLSRTAVRAGAELLVNLTNDGWFRVSKAPYQHHLIASFRAIENQRYLLRSTNTGLTGVVDPFGKTIASIPAHQEGTLVTQVTPLRISTIYQDVGDSWLIILSLIALALAFRNRLLVVTSTR